MTYRTFAFQPPRWRTPTRTNVRAGMLLFGTVAWCGLYIWLGQRLYHGTGLARDRVALGLILATVAMGVGVVIGWRQVAPALWQRARDRLDFSSGRARSLSQLQNMTPQEFEQYVADRIFARHGYHVENTPDTKDGGIDILVADRFGNQAVVQCKRYRGVVSAATIRDLYGTMAHIGATRGYLITTGRISRDARVWAQGKPIDLIDGNRLVALARAEATLELRL